MKCFRFLTLLVSFTFPCVLFSQSTNASLTGMVDDPSKAVIPNVSVTAINTETGVKSQTFTNSSGQYVLSGLIPGAYRVEVDKQGFKGVIEAGLVLHVQDIVQMNFHMAVGSSSETVSVDATGLTMNTTDGSVSTVIDRQFVANIPLNGRSFQDLISLTPGVVTQSPQSNSYSGAYGDFSVNGQRTQSNYYAVDGISANTDPGYAGGPTASSGGNIGASTALGTTQSVISVDALQEFRVESSTYSSEFGTSPGGQFSFATRSGTSSFHGSVFEYLRNNIFDANDWFNNHYGIAQSALRQNNFGGTFGGPIRVPGLTKEREATFFFFSYEGLRLTQPTEASLQYVPSVALRTSGASGLQPMLNAFPLPTGAEIQIACSADTIQCPMGQPTGTLVPSGLAPNILAYSLPSELNSTSLRLDHQLDSRIHAFFRAGYTPSSTNNRTLSDLGTTAVNNESFTGGVDLGISNAFNDQLRIGYARALTRQALGVDDFGGATGVNLSQAFGTGAYPTAYPIFDYEVTGVGGAALAAGNSASYSRQWNLTNIAIRTLGRQSIKVGGEYRRITSPYAPNSPEVISEYISPASIMSNSADFGEIYFQRSPEPVFNQLAIFVQDEWHINSSFTLSLGLRWDIEPPPTSNNASKPYPLLGNPNDPSTYSLGTPGNQLYKTNWHNFAPRLGAAWQAYKKPGAETVLRGGLGWFYDTGTSATPQVFQSIGTTARVYPPSLSLPVTSAQLVPVYTPAPPYGTVYAVSPNFELPYTLEWSSAIEQAIGGQQHLTLSYVGSNGRRLVKESYIDAGLQNSQFTYVPLYENGLTSNYQALQVLFQRQIRQGLQALASYTWSHNIDFGSEDANYAYIRGNSDFDVRNNLNAALTWDLPLNKADAMSKTLLNGWGLDARLFARTGFPVSLTGNGFYDPVTGSFEYAGLNIVPDSPFFVHSTHLPGGRAINASAFTSPPANIVGDAPRNFLRGFGATQINMAVRREVHLFENARLQFRAEAFNVLNAPSFGRIDPYLSDATFGQATSTLANSLGTLSPLYQQGGARSMQFALKIIF